MPCPILNRITTFVNVRFHKHFTHKHQVNPAAKQPASHPAHRPASQPASQQASQPASKPASQPSPVKPASQPSQPANQLSTSQPASHTNKKNIHHHRGKRINASKTQYKTFSSTCTEQQSDNSIKTLSDFCCAPAWRTPSTTEENIWQHACTINN